MITVREALRKALEEEISNDSEVFLIGEEVGYYQGAYKISQGLIEQFGAERIIDTPITEHGFAGLAIGAAFMGLKPIVEFMTFNFAMQAIDQIVNSAAKTLYMSGGQVKCPIVFRGPNGAAAGVAAQHSQCYASWYSHIPGLKVIAPYSAEDHYLLLKAAIRDPGPVIFLENEVLYGHSHSFDINLNNKIGTIGQAKVLREGKDLTMTSFSLQTSYALEAAQILAKDNIEIEVIDLRTLSPLDTQTIIQSVKKTNKIITIEEGWPFGGIGAEIAMRIMENCFDYLDAPIVRVCSENIPMPYAKNLEELTLPNTNKIVEAVYKLLKS